MTDQPEKQHSEEASSSRKSCQSNDSPFKSNAQNEGVLYLTSVLNLPALDGREAQAELAEASDRALSLRNAIEDKYQKGKFSAAEEPEVERELHWMTEEVRKWRQQSPFDAPGPRRGARLADISCQLCDEVRDEARGVGSAARLSGGDDAGLQRNMDKLEERAKDMSSTMDTEQSPE